MLAGVLVDVSGSMRSSLQPDVKLEDQPTSRAQTIFSTIINIAQREVDYRDNHQIFALAFGLEDVNTCDLLSLLNYLRTLYQQSSVMGHEPLIRLLETNGAPYAGEYVKKYVPRQAAGTLFETYSQNNTLLQKLIAELPSVCKNRAKSIAYSASKKAYSTPTGKTVYSAGKIVYSAGKMVYSAGKMAYSAGKTVYSSSASEIAYSVGKKAYSTPTGKMAYSAGKMAYSAGKTVYSSSASEIAYSAGKMTYSAFRNILFFLSTVYFFTDALDVVTRRDAQNAQDAEKAQDTENPQDPQDIENPQDTQDIENSQDTQDIENPQDIQNSQDPQNAMIFDMEEKIAREHVNCAIRLSTISKLKAMSRPKKKSLEFVISLLRDVAMMSSSSSSSSSTTQSLSAVQLSSLVSSIEPYIYGGTPMCEALRYALDMFHSATHKYKALFLLTDGESADGNPAKFAKQFRDCDVYVFACLLTSDNISNPRRLYDSPDPNWTNAQRTLFELCTSVSNMHPAMSILLEQNWQLAESGQSRLFLQANHPDVINEFSSLVHQMGESNDVLLNMCGRYSLDIDINISNYSFEPEEQTGETCYAYAVATVFHLAMCRIEGREGGVPAFSEICDSLIKKYGKNKAITENVLKEQCPTYRLQYKRVDEREARMAINARRPVVATFGLHENQWKSFTEFFNGSKKYGILKAEDLGTGNSATKLFRHAVVLIRCDVTSLTLMNWWGTEFADRGFFKVRNQSVLNLCFYDVYWTLENLKESEIAAFQAKSNKIGQKIMQNLPESVQNLLYKCPECNQSSRALEFTGDLRQATCPKCNKNFKPVAVGLIQSLCTR